MPDSNSPTVKSNKSQPKPVKKSLFKSLKSIEINSTISVSIMVMLMILGAGAYTGYFAYTVGTKSLEAVNEPESNPSKKLAAANNAERVEKGFVIIPENEIILRNTKQMKGLKTEPLPSSQTKSEPSPTNQEQDGLTGSSSSDGATPDQEQGENIASASLPLSTEDQGVRLTVENIKKLNNSLTMEVTLVNKTSKEVRFLYSFLDVRDDKGLSLSAIADGLPGQLPADQKTTPVILPFPYL
ncbi:MAG: hypothetical protein HC796_07350 [Synechococcaceae cyanobacterium RL_1_2]|nr:hypothetical protein [Synechococcaceae cyanobacterium RL_1_2]